MIILCQVVSVNRPRVELPFLSLAPEILRLRVKKDHAGEVTSFFW